MRNITSLTNEEIKNIVALKDAKERYAQKKFVAEGVRTIKTILQGNITLSTLYIIPDMLEQALAFVPAAHIVIVSQKIMEKISHTTTPSGMLALFDLPDNPNPDLLTPGLVLAQISDPGNMGTLIRTAAALNISSIVIIGGVDPFNPKVIQATAGTIAKINIFTWNWQELMENKLDLKLHALVVNDGASLSTVEKKSALLVVGNEASGIPNEWLAQCSDKITIAMPGNTESLNAAIAGSIAAYEVFGK